MPVQVFTGSLTRPMPQYGAANGEGLRSFALDVASGALTSAATQGGIDDTGWVVADTGRGVLYATCEITGADQSAVAAFRIEMNGFQLINRQPTAGNEACHASLSRDGRYLLVANYNGAVPEGLPTGSVSVFPLAEDGTIGPVACTVEHRGSGPNPDRQTCAHAHCVVPAPDCEMVHVADLGMDRIFAYRLEPTGQLVAQPEADFVLPPGLGPRHVIFSAAGDRLFMVSELIPTVVSLTVADDGTLSEADSFSIPSLDGGIVQPAGILLHPDGRHLFVGLRVCDEILGLEIGPDGELSQTGRWPSGGRTPRDFALSPDGRHLVVANQDSDRLSVFAVDTAGRLGSPTHEIDVGTPMSVTIAAR